MKSRSFGLFVAFASLFGPLSVNATAAEIKTIFVIAMENHNWVQPNNKFTGDAQQIYQNPNAPFINGLVNGSAFIEMNGVTVHVSQQVAYATAYYNVPNIHPSEPNYIWAEAGSSLGVTNDNDPLSSAGPTVQNTSLHFTSLLARAGIGWKSYQEDIDLAPNSNGQLTSDILPASQWTVPLGSISGTLAAGYFNQYNGSNHYDYAAKHNPMLFFMDTNGAASVDSAHSLAAHYVPLQQLAADLASHNVASYNWITPNLNNDMHTALSNGYKGLIGDDARIRQGDDFLGQVVPMIMASDAYRDHGAIIIWWDESEDDGVVGDNPDDSGHTIGEIVISVDARENVAGIPYASPLNHTHSSDLKTMQEIFNVEPFLGDARNANDLSDLFKPGSLTGKLCKEVGIPRFAKLRVRHCY